jgi:sulfoxide reductase heme-binding subunit YedZ
MPKWLIVVLKTGVHLACLLPVAWLVWAGYQNNLGPDPTHTVTFFTGRAILRLLAIMLAISPLRKMFPKRLGWLIRFRRLVGMYAFFYACLHLLTYVWLYAGFSLNAMVQDISQRKFITAGLAAWLLLLPLAVTSTAWSIRKLGGKNWNRMHKLVYVAAVAGLVHYWWGVKPGVWRPLDITLVIGGLLLARPLIAVWKRREAPVAVKIGS